MHLKNFSQKGVDGFVGVYIIAVFPLLRAEHEVKRKSGVDL